MIYISKPKSQVTEKESELYRIAIKKFKKLWTSKYDERARCFFEKLEI